MAHPQREYVERELARLPIGTRVRVKGCPGLEIGVVRGHITEYVTGSVKNRKVIPLVGHCKMVVEFEDGGPGGTYNSTELARV